MATSAAADMPAAATDLPDPNTRQEMLKKQAHYREQCEDYYTSFRKATKGAVLQFWTDGDGDGPTPNRASGGRPDTKAHAQFRLRHFDIQDTTNWTLDDRGYAETQPANVRASDQVVFWAVLFMTGIARAATYPADFDTHGNIRATRVPQGPPMIIESHGLYYFPVYKDAYVLCGSYWRAMGWMLSDCVPRTKRSKADKMGFSVGMVIAPPMAAQGATILHLNHHDLPSHANLHPTTLIQAARAHDVYLRFTVDLDADCWVIQDKNTVGLECQIGHPGFHHLAAAGADANNIKEAIPKSAFVERGLESRYGNLYQTWNGDYDVPFKANWADYPSGRRRGRSTTDMTEASGIQPTTNTASTIPTATEGSDVQLPTDVASSIASETEESGVQLSTDVASDIARETEASTAQPSPDAVSAIPTATEARVVGASTDAASTAAAEQIHRPSAPSTSFDPRIAANLFMSLMNMSQLQGVTAAAHIFPALARVSRLYSSVRCNRLASSTAAEGLTDDERVELAERLGRPISRVDRIVSMTTSEDTAHLMDYIHLADGLALTENELRALDDGPVRDALFAIFNQYRSFGDDHQQGGGGGSFVPHVGSSDPGPSRARWGLSQPSTSGPPGSHSPAQGVQRTGSVRPQEVSPLSGSQTRVFGGDHQQEDQELFVSQRQSGHSRGQLASSGLSQSQTRAPSVQRTGSVRLREDSPRSDSPRGKRSRIASSPETPEAVREG